jgi:hypothetical protein
MIFLWLGQKTRCLYWMVLITGVDCNCNFPLPKKKLWNCNFSLTKKHFFCNLKKNLQNHIKTHKITFYTLSTPTPKTQSPDHFIALLDYNKIQQKEPPNTNAPKTHSYSVGIQFPQTKRLCSLEALNTCFHQQISCLIVRKPALKSNLSGSIAFRLLKLVPLDWGG